ncbi:hypothetical protein CEXT_315051, partial [Caerostris extrusa]
MRLSIAEEICVWDCSVIPRPISLRKCTEMTRAGDADSFCTCVGRLSEITLS